MVALGALSTDLYLSGIPAMAAEYGAAPAQAQATVGVFMAGFALAHLFLGTLSDHFGRKPVLWCGAALYVATSLLCAFAPDIHVLLAGRAAQGVAAATGPVLARAIVTDYYRGREAARVMSSLMAAMALVPTTAPVIGSWLLYWFDWRSHFYAQALFGLLILAGAGALRESSPSIGKRRLQAGHFLRQFGRHLAHPKFTAYTLIGSSVFGGILTYVTNSSFVVTGILGVPVERFGYTQMVISLGYLIGAYSSAQLVVRFGIVRLLCGGIGVCALAVLLLIGQQSTGQPGLVGLIGCVSLFCCGCGAIIANSQSGAISVFPATAGSASAVFGFLQTSTGAVFAGAASALYDGTVVPLIVILAVSVSCASCAYLFLLRVAHPED